MNISVSLTDKNLFYMISFDNTMVDFKKRIEKIWAKVVEKNNIERLIVTGASNIYYLSGTDAASAAILSENGLLLISPRLEYLRAIEETHIGKVVAFVKGDVEVSEYEEIRRGELLDVIKDALAGLEPDRIGLVATSKDFKQKVEEKLGAQVKDATKDFTLVRRQKEDIEIKMMIMASRIAEQALRRAVDMLEPGITEAEVASEIIKFFVRRGHTFSFYPIVAFGEHSAHPHAKPSLKKLREGEFVKIDIGAKYNGYCSDITRTFVFGRASSRQKRLFNAVLRAQRESMNEIKSNIDAVKPYQTAYKILKEEGLAKYFNHGLGHGVGIDIHENPYLTYESKERLLTGDVVTVEPGVYLAGYGGIRIEDMVVVEENGYRLITLFDKEFEI